MGKVGPFFYINNKIYGLGKNINEINNHTRFINHPISHYSFFIKCFSFLEEEYSYYPRGRVVYDSLKRRYLIYIDSTLINNIAVINRVKRMYNLDNEIIMIKTDNHYHTTRI